MTPHIYITLRVPADQAALMAEWVRQRGGVAEWHSINLSNPGARWLAPADVKEKPTWQFGNQPALVETNPARIMLVRETEVKRFRVAVRLSSNGLMLKLTDYASERVRQEVAKAERKHGAASYRFDYAEQQAVILARQDWMTLAEWMRKQAELPQS